MMGIPSDLRTLLCEGTDLDDSIQFDSQAEKEAFQNVTCSLDPQQLRQSQLVFLRNVDRKKLLTAVTFPYLFICIYF